MTSRKKAFFYFALVAITILAETSCQPIQVENNQLSVPTPSIDELIVLLESPDSEVRATAADQAVAFANHPDREELVPHLVKALDDENERVRMFAAQSFGRLGVYDEKGLRILVSWLYVDRLSGEELFQSVQVINRFSEYEFDAVPALLHVMTHPPTDSAFQYHVQEESAWALAAFGDLQAVPQLLELALDDSKPTWLRKSVLLALAKFETGARCTVPRVVPLLDSVSTDLQLSAAIVIARTTENAFPDSEPMNWDPNLLGAFEFRRNLGGSFVIVETAKEWWKKEGEREIWQQCASVAP